MRVQLLFVHACRRAQTDVLRISEIPAMHQAGCACAAVSCLQEGIDKFFEAAQAAKAALEEATPLLEEATALTKEITPLLQVRFQKAGHVKSLDMPPRLIL
jgi:hypothetical protein